MILNQVGRCGEIEHHSALGAFSDRFPDHLNNRTGTRGGSQSVFQALLEVELEIKISIIEAVNSNISVLSTASVATSVRVKL